jgi:soluble lytic murein transglycosylase-like protein
MRTFAGCLGVLTLLGIARPLPAAEHVTLKNGFDLVCDHREQTGDRIRLFTNQDSGNFVEVDAAEIVSVDLVPDPSSAPSAAPAAEPKLTETDIHQLINQAGAQHNLDVDLLASVVRAESGGNVHAISRTGARGLMQLMPGTAAELGVTDSFRADQNINGGTAYLDTLLIRYHDHLALALAAYNAGPAAVDKYHGVPPYRETRVYVARVIREFNRRKQREKQHPLGVAN